MKLDDTIELEQSPQRASEERRNELGLIDNKNSIVAFHILQIIQDMRAQPELWNSISEDVRIKLNEMRGLGFDAYYPSHLDFTGIKDMAKESMQNCKILLNSVETMQDFISDQEKHWKEKQQTYCPDLLHQMQDNVFSMQHLPLKTGGKIVTYGSARLGPESDAYAATLWLNETIVTGSLREDGKSESVVSGAGPGIMEAANKGAMRGKRNILNTLNERLKDFHPENQRDIRAAIFKARTQIHSLGIRIDLPFEQTWNDYLELSIGIKNFSHRKGGLTSATSGRSVTDAKKDTAKHSNHPAIFALPGGFGTMDELWEMACLIQCGKSPTVPIFAVGTDMSDYISYSMKTMESWGTINPKDKLIITPCKDEVDAVEKYHTAHNLPLSEYTLEQIQNHKPLMDKKKWWKIWQR